MTPTRNRICAALTDPVQEDREFLKTKGYSDAEIVREGIRMFALMKRQQAVPA